MSEPMQRRKHLLLAQMMLERAELAAEFDHLRRASSPPQLARGLWSTVLGQAAGATAEKAAELRGRAMQQLRAMRETLTEAQGKAVERTKAAAKATDEYVHDHPWQVVAGATAVGVVIGMLIARNR